ncbi:hypothetical protein J3R83DRAFT_5564 [Lanmaoa asiatica]|nr:hypothetical protein J3R83DRAFT_5564 [Lanmaoa asiatica]
MSTEIRLYHVSKVPGHSSPLGVSFISTYKSYLLTHALFALYPKVEFIIITLFGTIFRDICRVIEEQWNTFVGCIDTGSIPDSVELLKFLRVPNAQRSSARFVRMRTRPDGLTKIWPGLRVFVAISSGSSFALGRTVELRTLGIDCSEAFLALAYDHRDANLYKVVGSDDNASHKRSANRGHVTSPPG